MPSKPVVRSQVTRCHDRSSLGHSRRLPYPGETQLKLIDIIFESATDIPRATGAVPAGTAAAEIVNLPVFRYCLAMAVLLTRWIAAGRKDSASPA